MFVVGQREREREKVFMTDYKMTYSWSAIEIILLVNFVAFCFHLTVAKYHQHLLLKAWKRHITSGLDHNVTPDCVVL